jgi:hypothetical protein
MLRPHRQAAAVAAAAVGMQPFWPGAGAARAVEAVVAPPFEPWARADPSNIPKTPRTHKVNPWLAPRGSKRKHGWRPMSSSWARGTWPLLALRAGRERQLAR